MDDPGDIIILCKNRMGIIEIAEVYLVVLDLLAGDFFNTFKYPEA